MTFEEFFRKKKIDLMLLKASDPALFEELHLHYEEMGPKSFDHSKKFLFNILRRKYHLQEEVKQIPADATDPAPETKPAYKPLFKRGIS